MRVEIKNAMGCDIEPAAPPWWNLSGKLPCVPQPKVNMIALKRDAAIKETGDKPEDPASYPRPKLGVFGVEMIEKEVKSRGNTGRIYLPADWVGKMVKIIRID